MRGPGRPALAAFAAGASSVLAHAPFGWFPLAPLALAALFWLLVRPGGPARARDGFGLGFAWNLGAFAFGVSWLFVALHRYGNMPAPLAAFAIALFCAAMALYGGLAGALFARLRGGAAQAPGLRDALLFAGLWLLAEWLRGWLLTGFPWLASGYSQLPPSPLAGFAPVVGVYGVGGLVALVAAAGTLAVVRRNAAAAALALAVVAGGIGLGRIAWTSPVGEPLRVVLVQTNIEQHLKWRPELLPRWLAENLRLVRENPAPLVVLPETTLPLLVEQLPDGYVEALARAAGGGDVVFGTFVRDREGRIFNAALTAGGAPPQQYAKQHLVPFGEYSPPSFEWFYRVADIPMADQSRGEPRQAPLALGGQRIAVNICYEDVFGEELIRALPDATLMLNLSNLAWYGDSFAQPQHLAIARMRALETGRPMLRATNTGMTAVISPDGRVEKQLPAFAAGALHADVRGFEGMTPYARAGNAPAVGAALALVALGALRRTPLRHKTQPTNREDT